MYVIWSGMHADMKVCLKVGNGVVELPFAYAQTIEKNPCQHCMNSGHGSGGKDNQQGEGCSRAAAQGSVISPKAC